MEGVKSEHFIVYYLDNENFAQEVSRGRKILRQDRIRIWAIPDTIISGRGIKGRRYISIATAKIILRQRAPRNGRTVSPITRKEIISYANSAKFLGYAPPARDDASDLQGFCRFQRRGAGMAGRRSGAMGRRRQKKSGRSLVKGLIAKHNHTLIAIDADRYSAGASEKSRKFYIEARNNSGIYDRKIRGIEVYAILSRIARRRNYKRSLIFHIL